MLLSGQRKKKYAHYTMAVFETTSSAPKEKARSTRNPSDIINDVQKYRDFRPLQFSPTRVSVRRKGNGKLE